MSTDGGSPEVRVIDHGGGHRRPTVLPRIFDPLEQGEELNTRTHQGVGLGLTLARMSARAMDGDVVLESTGPHGSTFLWRPVSASPRRAHLKRRMCTFSRIPIAMKFASICDPP